MDTILLPLVALLAGLGLGTAAFARWGGLSRHAPASAAALVAAGVAVLGWQIPTGMAQGQGQPPFDQVKYKLRDMPQPKQGVLTALQQLYPNAVGITIVNADGSAEYFATKANQPIYAAEPPMPPGGHRENEKTVTHFAYVYNPTCVWQYVGGQYMLVSGRPQDCIQG